MGNTYTACELRAAKKEAIDIIEQLGYKSRISEPAIEAIKKAKNQIEIDRALTTARHRAQDDNIRTLFTKSYP